MDGLKMAGKKDDMQANKLILLYKAMNDVDRNDVDKSGEIEGNRKVYNNVTVRKTSKLEYFGCVSLIIVIGAIVSCVLVVWHRNKLGDFVFVDRYRTPYYQEGIINELHFKKDCAYTFERKLHELELVGADTLSSVIWNKTCPRCYSAKKHDKLMKNIQQRQKKLEDRLRARAWMKSIFDPTCEDDIWEVLEANGFNEVERLQGIDEYEIYTESEIRKMYSFLLFHCYSLPDYRVFRVLMGRKDLWSEEELPRGLRSPLRNFYDILSEEYEMTSYAEFVDYISDKENQVKLYNELKGGWGKGVDCTLADFERLISNYRKSLYPDLDNIE